MYKKLLFTFVLLFGSLITIYPSKKEDINLFDYCYSFEKITKNKLNFNIKNKIIYTISIFGFVIILGLLLFFISQSKKNESTITNKSILLEKKILII